MRVYHERLRVPVSWWLVDAAAIIVLGAEVAAGFSFLIIAAIYLVLIAGGAGMLFSWGRATIEVNGSELSAGRARLPLAAAGRVTALDKEQTRVIRGPRADPAAFLLIRPYLREAVYVEVTGPLPGPVTASPSTGAAWLRYRVAAGWLGRWLRPGSRPGLPGRAAEAPYWLLGTRHPAELAAAIERSRPVTHPDGAIVG